MGSRDLARSTDRARGRREAALPIASTQRYAPVRTNASAVASAYTNPEHALRTSIVATVPSPSACCTCTAAPGNIQSGVMYGWAGLVDGLVERLRAEMGGPVKVVATGGLAGQMLGVARTVDLVNPDLTLEGLRTIWERAHP